MRTPSSWDTVWSQVAKTIATRSKDPNTQVGAVIVSPDNKECRSGYNGFPVGIKDTEKRWKRPEKYDRILHSEANAIIFAKTDLTEWTMYVTMFPCRNCANLIIQSGITRVVYQDDDYKSKDDSKTEQILADFKEANIQLERKQL